MRLRVHVLSVVGAIVLFATPTSLKDVSGIDAIVQRVEFEPNAERPERIRIYGAFTVAEPHPHREGAVRYRLGRGYLHYRVNEADSSLTLRQWRAIARAAGTGRAVGFGALGGQNGELRLPYSADTEPDEFPLGLPFLSNVPGHRFVWRTVGMTAPVSPAPDDTVSSGEIRLVAWPAVLAGQVYVFEIEANDGTATRSASVTPDDRAELSWTPPVELRPGTSYTWRVWIEGGRRPQFGNPLHTAR